MPECLRSVVVLYGCAKYFTFYLCMFASFYDSKMPFVITFNVLSVIFSLSVHLIEINIKSVHKIIIHCFKLLCFFCAKCDRIEFAASNVSHD